MFKFFFIYDRTSYNFKVACNTTINSILLNLLFINRFNTVSLLMWQEGLLIDFLQKKIVDNLIKKFLICSSYLFNERLVFDKIIKFYLNLIIWPMHKLFIFEYNNVANTLFILVFFFILFVFSLYLFYLIFIII